MACSILFIIYLAAASVSDIRTHEVPVWYGCAAAAVRAVFLAVLHGGTVPAFIVPALALAGILSVPVFLGKLGGADCIAGGLCGLYLGMAGIYAVMAAFLMALPFTAVMKVRGTEREYPFIPFIAAGAALVMVSGILL